MDHVHDSKSGINHKFANREAGVTRLLLLEVTQQVKSHSWQGKYNFSEELFTRKKSVFCWYWM